MYSKEHQKLKESEFIEMHGTPTITVRDRDGNVIQQFTDHNLIVKVGRSYIIKLLAGAISGKSLTKCALGTGGVSGDVWTPIAPVEANTALVAEVVSSRKAISATVIEAVSVPTKVVFTTLFLSTEVNAIVSEAGLFFNDDTMFARYTFPSIYMRNDKGYSLEIAWEVKF